MDSKGRLYVLAKRGLSVIDGEGKKIKAQPLELTPVQTNAFQRSSPVVLDEVHDRLVRVHYWNLKDGSFHGVVPILPQRRPRNQPGPFDGVDLYYEAGRLAFAADDPNRRFLYMTRIDTHQLFRFDLEKRLVAALLAEGGGTTG